MMSEAASQQLRVQRIEWEAEGIFSLALAWPDGADLPAYAPGAHIDLALPNGITRSYSLCGDPADRKCYVVAVGLDAASRGGSAYIHAQLRVGQMLTVSGPRNHFPLVQDAPMVVLIAGGIGITPLFCMARQLSQQGRPYAMHYAARNPQRMAFLPGLKALQGAVHAHFDDTAGGPLDVAAIFARYAKGTHFYCCGPLPMLAAFETAASAAGVAEDCVHVEYFTAKPQDKAGAESSFTVVLGRSGGEFTIPADKSILDVLTAGGIKIESSCQDGICGTCEVKVLEGMPDHRDSVLTKAEQAAGKSMMVCVSRCQGARLVLDL